MIFINIALYPDGYIKNCRAEGHSFNASPGSDIICSAVTILLRTAARILFLEESIKVEGSAAEAGEMEFHISMVPQEKKYWIKGVTDYLLRGIFDLQKEYPDRLSINIS